MAKTSASADPAQLEESIEIAASPAQVWALVTDLPRMREWSPQVVRTWVLGGTVEADAHFVNLNHQGWKHWPTTAKVVRFLPHTDFAFRITENRTVWSFTLEPVDVAGTPGTRLTQRRETPHGISAVSNVGVNVVLGGQSTFTASLRTGMQQTLQRLKAAAER